MATRRHPIIPALRDPTEVTPLATASPPLGQCYRPNQRMPPHGIDLLISLRHSGDLRVVSTNQTAMNADGYWWELADGRGETVYKTDEIAWWCLLRDVLDLVKPPLP